MKKNINISFDEINEQFQNFQEKAREDTPFIKKASILFVSAIMVFLITHFINDFQQGSINDANTKQSEYQTIEQFLAENQQATFEYNKTIDSINGEILKEEDVDKAVSLISKLATNNNVTIANGKKSDKPEDIGNGVMTYANDIQVSGEYQDVINFLKSIENESFFVSIDTVTITPDKRSISKINAKLTYQIFFISSVASASTKTATN